MESQAPSLLVLNDYCLMDIFKLLSNDDDYINLAKTCSRLRAIGSKYKNIYVAQTVARRYWHDKEKKIEEINKKIKLKLLSFLSAVGEHVLSVKADGKDLVFLEILADNCKNLKTLAVDDYEGPLPFKNLNELKLGSKATITSKELKLCFQNNPDIHSLEYNGVCDRQFMESLKMLPKLKNLQVKDVNRSQRLNLELLHLLSSMGDLTSFSFRSTANRNEFLIELGKQLNLLKLEFYMPYDADTFDILRSFRNLEALSMNVDEGLVQLEAKDFPLMLTFIRLDLIKISCSSFLSFIKHMKFLKEFDLGSKGYIHSDHEESEFFPTPFWRSYKRAIEINGMLSAVIDNELRSDERILKLHAWRRSWPEKNPLFQRNLSNLEIVIRNHGVNTVSDRNFSEYNL